MKRIVITPFRISETNKDILSRLDELHGKKVLKNSWNLSVAGTPSLPLDSGSRKAHTRQPNSEYQMPI
jgi:hypothetical protein